VGSEEFEGSCTSEGGGNRFEGFALIAVEAVAGVFVDEHRNVRVRVVNLFSFLGTDVLIEGAKLQEHRTGGLFLCESGNLAAVISHRSGGTPTGCGQPG